MARILLVHGAWHGAWCWAPVEALLRGQGHTVFSYDMVDMGDDYTKLTTGIGLKHHVEQLEDIAASLADVDNPLTIVAHSYGGLVTSGALPALRSSIKQVLFLDALFPTPGHRLSATIMSVPPPVPPWLKQWSRAVMRNVLLSRPIPIPPVAFFGIEDHELATYALSKLHPSPAAFFHAFTRYEVPSGLPFGFIRCTGGDASMVRLIQPYVDYAVSQRWPLFNLDSGHDAMLIDPMLTAQLIGLFAVTSAF